jgi:hypothetical protein
VVNGFDHAVVEVGIRTAGVAIGLLQDRIEVDLDADQTGSVATDDSRHMYAS